MHFERDLSGSLVMKLYKIMEFWEIRVLSCTNSIMIR